MLYLFGATAQIAETIPIVINSGVASPLNAINANAARQSTAVIENQLTRIINLFISIHLRLWNQTPKLAIIQQENSCARNTGHFIA